MYVPTSVGTQDVLAAHLLLSSFLQAVTPPQGKIVAKKVKKVQRLDWGGWEMVINSPKVRVFFDNLSPFLTEMLILRYIPRRVFKVNYIGYRVYGTESLSRYYSSARVGGK